MNIIVGHSNMDLDCFGSMVLARYLFPEYTLVTSRFIHPIARNLYNLYQNHLNMIPTKDLEGEDIDHMIIVDTRTMYRVKEYFDVMGKPPQRIDVFDHHTNQICDIENAVLHEADVGANTTLIGISCMEKQIEISPEDATIALTGIYADTGNFTHENVRDSDFHAASYCASCNASIKLVKEFMKPLRDEFQITLFHELLNRISYQDIHGHFIILTFLELEKQTGGLAAVVEKVFEVENTDAIFALFSFKKERDVVIVARSQKPSINVQTVLSLFGGGGHPAAASAIIKKGDPREIFERLVAQLHTALIPAVIADQIMTKDVGLIHEDWNLLEASMFLERINHTGAPVVNAENLIAGFMTLKDIMKGRKAKQMHAPVKAYMTRKIVTGRRNSTVREIEQLLYQNNIGHLPVVEEGRIVGLVTRSDYLNFIKEHIQTEKPILQSITI